MHLIYTAFIALANNIDNISVIITYSIRGIKISTTKNLWLSVITFFISSLATFSGSFISTLLNKHVASILSMLLLTGIGIWILIEPKINKENNNKAANGSQSDNKIYDILKNPEKADSDNSKDIDFKEATFLGIALSLNNIGGGISAGMIGLNSTLVGFFSAIISFLALWAGNYFTGFFNKRNLGNKATVFSGILLILIGIKQII